MGTAIHGRLWLQTEKAGLTVESDHSDLSSHTGIPDRNTVCMLCLSVLSVFLRGRH